MREKSKHKDINFLVDIVKSSWYILNNLTIFDSSDAVQRRKKNTIMKHNIENMAKIV